MRAYRWHQRNAQTLQKGRFCKLARNYQNLEWMQWEHIVDINEMLKRFKKGDFANWQEITQTSNRCNESILLTSTKCSNASKRAILQTGKKLPKPRIDAMRAYRWHQRNAQTLQKRRFWDFYTYIRIVFQLLFRDFVFFFLDSFVLFLYLGFN
jgi:hypothetical protein